MLAGILLSLMLWASPSSAQTASPMPLEYSSAPLPPPPEGFITEPGVHVDVYGRPNQLRLLDAIQQRADQKVPAIAATLGVPLGGGAVIYVASSDREFMDLQPGRPPEWADGTAWPEHGAVFLKSPAMHLDGAPTLFRVLDHELVHVVLGRAFAPHQPPRWLQEGLARNLANEQGPEDARRIQLAMSRGGMHSLEALHYAFPRDASDAQLAYAESADFVAFVWGEHGDAAIRRLVLELARGQTVDAAIYRATGETLPALDGRWRARFSSGGFALAGALDAGLFGFGVLAIAALIRKRMQLRARMDAMAADEAARDALLTVPVRPASPPQSGTSRGAFLRPARGPARPGR